MFDFFKSAIAKWKAGQRESGHLSFEGNGGVCLSDEAFEELIRSPQFKAQLEAIRELEVTLTQ